MLLPSMVAKRFGVSHVTLRKWARSGALPSITLPSGHMRFDEADVEAFEAKLRTKVQNRRMAVQNSSVCRQA